MLQTNKQRNLGISALYGIIKVESFGQFIDRVTRLLYRIYMVDNCPRKAYNDVWWTKILLYKGAI